MDVVTLTRTNDDEMTTTMTMSSKTNPTVAVSAAKRVCKWSGDEEPQSYYSCEDEATVTLVEQRRQECDEYYEWSKVRNLDEDNDGRVVAEAEAIVRSIRRESVTETAPPRRVSSAVWTTPWDEPVFETEYPDYAEESTHMPFMNLTKEEREKKSAEFKFGLCRNCETGLSDKSEFVGAFVCNACHDYYQKQAQPYACGGCN